MSLFHAFFLLAALVGVEFSALSFDSCLSASASKPEQVKSVMRRIGTSSEFTGLNSTMPLANAVVVGSEKGFSSFYGVAQFSYLGDQIRYALLVGCGGHNGHDAAPELTLSWNSVQYPAPGLQDIVVASLPNRRVQQLRKEEGMEQLQVTRLEPKCTYLAVLIESD
jgi:hypothetical protein